MKILCLLMPHFPLICETLRNPALEGRPAVVTYSSGSQKLVLDYSPELDGLHPDIPLQQAMARHGESVLLQADVPYYWSAFNEILGKLEGKSSLVEGNELGCAYLGLDGMQLIYPNDDAVINAVRDVLPGMLVSRIGIAENKFLAYLAARHCPPDGRQVLTGNVTAFLKDFPCDMLPLSVKSKNRLHTFGINTLGQVAALPLGPLQAQFGPEGKRIWQLAHGLDETPFCPRGMEEAIEESLTLGSVTVSMEAILSAAEMLLARVLSRESLKGRGIRRLVLWTRSWNEEHWERKINFKQPSMDIRTTTSRIKRVLESFPQLGPVEQVGLKITGLGYPGGRQNSLFINVRSRDHLINDIRQLEFRLGNPQVFTVKEVEPWSRIPERRYALTPTGR